jgi:hypothetical protein
MLEAVERYRSTAAEWWQYQTKLIPTFGQTGRK